MSRFTEALSWVTEEELKIGYDSYLRPKSKEVN
jgi:hypothetical protein